MCLFRPYSALCTYVLSNFSFYARVCCLLQVDPTNQTVYKGTFVDDVRQGEAIFETGGGVEGGGERYEGHYSDNKRHGKGKEINRVGDVLVGEWEEGDCVRGTMNYADGGVYVGEFNDMNDRHGQGRFMSAEGGVQEGRWEEDEFRD